MRAVAIALCLLPLGPTDVRAAPPAAELLSHRAAYRLVLQSTDNRSGIEAVEGGLVVEWRASCDGWISNQRLGFTAATNEGAGFVYDVRFSSWESLDNQQLRFTMRTYDDGELAEEARGQAALDPAGARGKVDFVTPEPAHLELPAGTIFPTEHVVKLIMAARAGDRFVAHDVFDGSGKDGLNRITAVIGVMQEIDGEKRWPVNLAYYSPDDHEALPDFQLSFQLSDRGVLRDVLLDYGDFALRGRLEKLEPLPVEACD